MKTPFLNGFTSTISKIGLLSAKPKLCIIYITRSCLQVQSQFCLPLNSRNASSIFYENQKYQKEMWRILNVRRGFKIYICQISCIRKNNALISPPHFKNNLSNALLLSFPPNMGEKLSKMAISYTLRTCLGEAHKIYQLPIPASITAHFVRSASNNAAFARHTIVKELCKAITR